MRLLQRIKHDLRAGWARVRYGTAQAATRAMEEAELLRLRLAVRKLDERIKDLHRDIGERAVELHERGEPGDRVLADAEIVRGAELLRVLKADRARLQREMDEVRGGE